MVLGEQVKTKPKPVNSSGYIGVGNIIWRVYPKKSSAWYLRMMPFIKKDFIVEVTAGLEATQPLWVIRPAPLKISPRCP